MTILNVGSFVNTLDAMHLAIAAKNGAGDEGGWQTSSSVNRSSYVDAPMVSLLTSGDGVLKTYDLAQEIIHENLGGKALIGTSDLWFDGSRHRQMSTQMSLVRNILIDAINKLDQGHPIDAYMVHVSDVDVNTVMNRPDGQCYSYFGSQMSIIDPIGGAHFLSMDRVRNMSVSHLSYAWRAMAVGEYEVCVQHPDASGQARIEPATHYIDAMGVRIAMFSRKFQDLVAVKPGLTTYAYRRIQRPALKDPTAGSETPVVDIRSRKFQYPHGR